MIRKSLVFFGLYMIVIEAIQASRTFTASSGTQQFWTIAMMMAGCGLWLGIYSPGTVCKVLSPREAGFWFPSVVLATLLIPHLGFATGTALLLSGLLFFWIFAKGTMKFVFGMEYSKRMNSGQ